MKAAVARRVAGYDRQTTDLVFQGHPLAEQFLARRFANGWRAGVRGKRLTCTGLTTPARAKCASSSYWPRPRLRSHPPTSMAELHLALQDNQTDPAMCPAVRLSRGRVWDTKVSVQAQPSKRRSTVDCLAAFGSSGLWTFVWRSLTSGWGLGQWGPPNADRNSNGSQSR